MPDKKIDLSVFDEAIPTQQTKEIDLSVFEEEPIKKKEESVVGVGESGDSPSLSSTPDRELLQEPQAVAPTSKEITPEKPKGNETVKALKSSSARAFGGIIGLPAFLTDQLGSFVVKPIAKGLGYSDEEAEGAAMALRAAPIMGATTSGLQSAEAQQQLNKYASSIEATMKQYEDGIIGSITNGNYSDAGAQLWKGAVQTLPYLAMTIATSGGGTPAVLSTIGTTAAAQRYGELQDPTSEEGKKLSETGKFVNSWGYGAFEAAGELVTMGLANAAKRTLSSLGKEAIEGVSQGIAKQAMKGFAEEGASEGATELSQQVLDIIQGVRDNVDFSAVTDAILVGGVTGAGISGTPTAISKAAKAIAGRKVASDADIKTVNENNAKVVDLLAEKEKATSPEAAQVIDTQLQEVVNENNEIITKNETIVEQMTPEQILKVNELDKTIAEYDSRIDDETETTDPTVLKSIRDELQKQKEEVVSVAAEQVGKTAPKEEAKKQKQIIEEKPTLVVDTKTQDIRADKNHIPYQFKNSNGDVIGSISVNRRDDLGGYQIENSSVEDKGKGIGKQMYKALIEISDKPIISDSSLTPEAKGVWDSLVKEGLAVFNEKTNKYFSVQQNTALGLKTTQQKPKEAISEPVEPLSAEEAPIVSPEQKEGLKQTKQESVVGEPLKDVESTKKALDVVVVDSPDAMSKMPNVSWHGSKNKDLVFGKPKDGSSRKSKMQLDFGTHFTEEGYASFYSGDKGRNYPSIIDLKKPLDLTKGVWYKGDPEFNEIYQLIKDLKLEKEYGAVSTYDSDGKKHDDVQSVSITANKLDTLIPKKVTEALKKHEYDGIIYEPYHPTGGQSGMRFIEKKPKSFIVLDNSSIKEASTKNIAEAYHKAKQDGSNPELVKAVEDLIGKQQNIPLQEQITEVKQVKQQENGKETSDETQGGQKGRQEKLLTEQEEKKVAETAGVKPKNLRDVYLAGREIFGLNKVQALAQAIIVDRVVAKAAKNSGKTKQQIYSEIEFRKEDELLRSKVNTYFQAAWHGSPYQFDKFTTEKIGTGEGAQAFGWGLYFTDLKSIAENYADKLSEKKLLVNGEEFSTSKLRKTLDKYDLTTDFIREKYSTVLSKLKDILYTFEQNKSLFENEIKDTKDAIYILKNNPEITYEKQRNLYKVELHKGKTTDQYDWLVWDEPITKKQAELLGKEYNPFYNEFLEYRKSLSKKYGGNMNMVKMKTKEESDVLNNLKDKYLEFGEHNKTGQQLYEELTDKFGSDKKASLFLLEKGIDGIKYPAESIARGATSETARGFNYVVFDENAVTIEEVIKFQKQLQGKRGAMAIHDGKSLIYALTDPNVSTPLHEIAHVYERYMLPSEKAAVLAWTGHKTWSVETSEKFARGFEKYLAEGVAPTEKLKAVFERFKTWLTDIYNGIKQSEIDVELNTEMKRLYDSILTGKKYTPSKEKVTTKEQEVPQKTYKDVDDLLFQSGDVKFQDTDKTERHTKALENLISHLESEKSENVAKEVNDYLKAKGNPISQELIDKVLKQRGYAKGTRTTTEEAGQQAQGVVEGKEGQIPVRNAEQDRKTEEAVRATASKTHKPTAKETTTKIGRFAVRVALEETKVPQAVKDAFTEREIGKYNTMSDAEAMGIADGIAAANTYEEMKKIVFDSNVHPSVRGAVVLKLREIMTNEYDMAEKEGNKADMVFWSDQAIDFLEDFNDKVHETALTLRFLGTQAFMESFAPFQHVREYQRKVNYERDKLINSKTHKKSFETVKKESKKVRDSAVDGALNDPTVKNIINKNSEKEPTFVPKDRLKQLKEKERAAIEKLRKALRGGTLTSGGINSEALEALGELAVVYVEEAGYVVAKAVKKLIKTAKDVGITLTEKEAQDLMPKEVDGKPIEDKIAEEATEKAAEKLASRIFGEVISSRKKEDPLLQMVNTLLGKFKERDLTKTKKESKTDIQKIAEAIANKEEYIEVWNEAKDQAISKVEENEMLTDDQKQQATDRINKAYDNATSFTFTEAQIDRAIKKKSASLGIRIDQIVKEFYEIQTTERGRLVDALIEESGLEAEQAKLLASAIENRFDVLLAEGKKKIVDKYIGKITGDKTEAGQATTKTRKDAVSEFLELVNIGAFQSEAFREAYATAVGIPVFTQAHADKIDKLAKEIRRQKEPIMKHKATQELMGYRQIIAGFGLSDIMTTAWYGNVLGNIKTQERNFFGGWTGVAARLMAEAVVTGRPRAIFRGYVKSMREAAAKFKDVWTEGYAPFSERIDIPPSVELIRGTGLLRILMTYWRYTRRAMDALDVWNATTGKIAFAEILANEALNVNRFKSAFNSKYRREVNQLVDKYLSVDAETVKRLKQEIEDDAAEFGYTDIDKKLILYDKIDRLRPSEVSEQAIRFGIFSTGNVQAYGTLGIISDNLAKLFRFKLPVHKNSKTGEVKYVQPLSFIAAFTKIAGNVGTMSMNFVPGVGVYRIVQGGYGKLYTDKDGKGNYFSKYSVDLTEREKKTIIGMQIAGAVSMSLLWALSDPGDDDDPLIRVTADGTGDWTKNRALSGEEWKEYSIGIKNPSGGRTWISYKYTPMIIPFSPIGFICDSKKYRKEYKDKNTLELFGETLLQMPSALADMTALSSMNDFMSGVLKLGETAEYSKVIKSLERIVSGFYTPGLYRDVVDAVEAMYGIGIDEPMKGVPEYEAKLLKERFLGRNPISIYKRIKNGTEYTDRVDVYGRKVEKIMPYNDIIAVKPEMNEEEKMIFRHQKIMGNPSVPQVKQTFFILDNPDGTETKIFLNTSDPYQDELWHKYIILRGKSIVESMSFYQDMDEEAYTDIMNKAIENATDDARFQISYELNANPPKKIKEWQKARKE